MQYICPECGSYHCDLLALSEFNQDEVGCQSCYCRGSMVEFSPKRYHLFYQGKLMAEVIDFGKGFIDLMYGENAELDIKELDASP